MSSPGNAGLGVQDKSVCAVVPTWCASLEHPPRCTHCGSKGCTAGGPPPGAGASCACLPKWAFPEGAGLGRPLLPSASVGQCQGPTACQSTRPVCLLASVPIVLEYVSSKLRVSVTAVPSLRGRAAVSLILGVLQGRLAISLRRAAHLWETVSVTQGLWASLLVTLGVPVS